VAELCFAYDLHPPQKGNNQPQGIGSFGELSVSKRRQPELNASSAVVAAD
jgi:hypothetical protein